MSTTVDPARIATFFYQGNGASRLQAAQYAGPGKPVIVVSHDGKVTTATHPTAPLLLHNLHDYPEAPEIHHEWSGWPIFAAMKGVNALRSYMKGVRPSRLHHVDYTKMSVGGKIDVAHHQRHAQLFLEEGRDHHSVLFGCSRGAATTLVSVALMSPEHTANISLVILEAPFDTVPSVLQQSAWVPPVLQLWLLETLGSYDPGQMTPLDAADIFPLDVPIAFITSRVDTRVPPASTQALIDRLRKRGHRKLHHLELKQSPHATMSLDNATDVKAYKTFVDMLYDLYC